VALPPTPDTRKPWTSPSLPLRRFLLAAALTALIATGVLTLMPLSAMPGGPAFQKVYHVLAFGAIAFAATLAFPRRVIWIIVLTSLYGGAIEVIQPYLGRNGNLEDWVADTVGAIAGGLAALGVIQAWTWKASKRKT
jgi:VanZ family protein